MTTASWTEKEGDLKDIRCSDTDDNRENFHNTWVVITETEYFGRNNGFKLKRCVTVQLCQYSLIFTSSV